jgi:hypothetical protein
MASKFVQSWIFCQAHNNMISKRGFSVEAWISIPIRDSVVHGRHREIEGIHTKGLEQGSTENFGSHVNKILDSTCEGLEVVINSS